MSQRVEKDREAQVHDRLSYWGQFFDETLYFDIQTRTDTHPKSNDPTLEDNLLFDPKIEIYNSDNNLLEPLSVILPGRLNSKFKKLRGKKYQGYSLRLRKGLMAYNFLNVITPYLVFKRPQAEVMKGFLRQKREVRRELEGLIRVPRYPTTEERIEVEGGFRNDLIKAKRKRVTIAGLVGLPRLAGAIDAGTYLGIYSTTRQDRDQNFPEYQALGGIGSRHHSLTEFIYRHYGGTKPVSNPDRSDRYQGPVFESQVGGSSLLKLLEDVEPYLIFKQTEARLIIDFLRVSQVLNRTIGKGYPTVFGDDLIVKGQRISVLDSYMKKWEELSKSKQSQIKLESLNTLSLPR